MMDAIREQKLKGSKILMLSCEDGPKVWIERENPNKVVIASRLNIGKKYL
jgi:hypothetical protein